MNLNGSALMTHLSISALSTGFYTWSSVFAKKKKKFYIEKIHFIGVKEKDIRA